jgi:hypothetical protein
LLIKGTLGGVYHENERMKTRVRAARPLNFYPVLEHFPAITVFMPCDWRDAVQRPIDVKRLTILEAVGISASLM